MADISFFVNDYYQMLSYMYDIRNKDNVARITQYELSEELFMCRVTANRCVKALREAGYIIQDPKHMSRYTLTDDAIKIVEAFRQAEK